MPGLIVALFAEETKQPVVWTCSSCDAIFSVARMTSNPTVSELRIVDDNFRTHCQHQHPGSSVAGLDIPAPKPPAKPLLGS